jgi:hypothetical protein
MNTPVSFEIAKLLKGKGFKSKNQYYNSSGEIVQTPDIPENDYRYTNNIIQRFRWEAPSICEVLMWLYEKHGIWIKIEMKYWSSYCWFSYQIQNKKRGNLHESSEFNSPDHSYESAILYSLKNFL